MKRLATIAVLVAIVGSNVFADAKPGGIARQISMGGSVAGSGLILNPFIMDDPALMFLNPAYQTMYKDYGWLNIGGGTLTGLSTADNGYGSSSPRQSAGVAFAINRELTLGAIFSHDPSSINTLAGNLGAIGTGFGIYQRPAQTIPSVLNVWELVGSWDGGDLDLGFGVMYGNSNRETTAPNATLEASARMIGFRGGVIADLGSGSSVDGSVAIRLNKVTDLGSGTAAPFTGEYSASATEIQAALRAKLKVSNKFNFVPYGMFATMSTEPKEDAPPTGGTATTNSLDLSVMAFALGVGGEYRTSNFYLAGGVSFQSARAKGEFATTAAPTANFDTSATYTGLPVVNIGAEWWFTDWLAGRAGYYRSMGSVNLKGEHQSGTFETDFTAPNSVLLLAGGLGGVSDGSLITLGLGFRFGAFSMDATVSEEALRRGLGLIGAQDNINTFGYITTSYNFE